MRYLPLTFTLLTWGAMAQTTVKVEPHATAQIFVNHHGIHKGGLKCGGGPGPTYRNDTREYRNDEAIEFSTTEVKNFEILTERSHIGSMYTIRAETEITQTKEISSIKLTLSEPAMPKSRGDGWTSGCENNHWTQIFQSGGYSGTVTFSYTPPPNVWAIEVSETEPNEIFKNADLKVLDNSLLDPQINGRRIVWVKPGVPIQRVFHIDNNKNKLRPKTSYTITFRPVGQDLDEAGATAAIANVSALLDNSKKRNTLFEYAFSLLQSQKSLKTAIKSYSTKELDSLSTRLFEVAMSEKINGSNSEAITLKSMAAILSFEIAKDLTDELASYCEMQTVNLPYSKQVVQIPGSRYAIYLMERLIGYLDSSAIQVYESFIKNISDLETKKVTYDKASNDEQIRRQLEEAFKYVRIVARPEHRPFSRAIQNLADFATVFRSVGTGEAATDTIAKNMSLLADKEDVFVNDMFAHVRQYGSGHDELINAANLRQELSELKALKENLVYNLRQHTRFLSIEGNSALDSLNGMLARFKAHNLNIIDHTLEKPKFPFDFENLRAAYVDVHDVKNKNNLIEKCLQIGDEK